MDNGRWTAEEYREYLKTGQEPARRSAVSPSRCQPARPSGVSLDEERTPYEKLSRRVTAYAAQEYMKKRGVTDAEVVLPEDQPKKKRKYRNEPVTVDGIRFDSKHEARVYQELMLRVKTGELKCVLRQVKFDLGGGPHAQKSSRYQYVADFVTIDRENKATVIDAKSEITRKNRTYINKKRQMLSEWGMEIEEV